MLIRLSSFLSSFPPFEFISEFISTQLVVLDFILEHRDIEHLEPEHDKFNFFCEQLGVSIEFLPGTLSEGGIGRRLSVCYFVDICPLFLGRYLPCSPVVTLSYPDSGIETIVGFLTHLGSTSPSSTSSLLFACFVYLQSTPSLRGQKNDSIRLLKDRLSLMYQPLLRIFGVGRKFESWYALPVIETSNS
jgi:hypothetical protein